MEILFAIDSVLEDERKSSTYKFALLASILDYVIENPSEPPTNGFHFIPIIYLAKRFLYYYYPLAYYPERGVKQNPGENLAIYSYIWKYVSRIEDDRYLADQNAVVLIRQMVEEEEIHKPLYGLLVKIRRVIIDQPLRYIKLTGDLSINEEKQNPHGGSQQNSLNGLPDYNLDKYRFKRRKLAFFGLVCEGVSPDSPYSDHLSRAKKWGHRWKGGTFWPDFEACESAFLKIGELTYRKLVSYRTLVRDAIIKRWIEFSVNSYLQGDGRAVYHLISSFNLQGALPSRDSGAMRNLRLAAAAIFSPMRCLYCDSKLTDFALDHIVPWSKFPTNYFWNLMPCCTLCNSRKSDHVVEMDAWMIQRLKKYLSMWLDGLEADRALRQVATRFGGRPYLSLSDLSKTEKVDALLEHLLIINDSIA